MCVAENVYHSRSLCEVRKHRCRQDTTPGKLHLGKLRHRVERGNASCPRIDVQNPLPCRCLQDKWTPCLQFCSYNPKKGMIKTLRAYINLIYARLIAYICICRTSLRRSCGRAATTRRRTLRTSPSLGCTATTSSIPWTVTRSGAYGTTLCWSSDG